MNPGFIRSEGRKGQDRMKGKIYGIGIGIGDPEDITLKAIKRIKESDVLICPQKDLEKCRAYQIAKQVVPEIEQIDTLPLEFPMTRDEKERSRNHRKIYETAKALVLQGKIVSFLTIGDPALYSTYSYIAALARKDGIEACAVSGVSSITVCANRLGITLCDGNEQLHVIPRTEDIEEALRLPGAKVIMKCGNDMPLVKKLLRGKEGIAVYAISGCGTPREKCYRSIDELPDDGNYMLTVIVLDSADRS